MTPALPAGCVIALLGAPHTGRHALAEALEQRLAQRESVSAGTARARVVVADAAMLPGILTAGPAILLLMALDLPSAAGQDERVREAADAGLRAALAQAGAAYAVVHGQAAQRLASAWNAILSTAEAAEAATTMAPDRSAAWSWSCDKCSDPACEHRLFTDLVAQRR